MLKKLGFRQFRWIKNSVVFLLLLVSAYWIYQVFANDQKDDFQIAESPIQVAQVREIAELSVLGIEEEFVLDTIEYYRNDENKFSGNAIKIKQLRNIKNVLRQPGVKRQLTLIVKAKAKIGFDLSDQNLQIIQNKDTVWIHTKKPKILSIERNPKRTKVFIENGSWTDGEFQLLLKRIAVRFNNKLKEQEIINRSEAIFKEMLLKLIKDERKILVYHDL